MSLKYIDDINKQVPGDCIPQVSDCTVLADEGDNLTPIQAIRHQLNEYFPKGSEISLGDLTNEQSVLIYNYLNLYSVNISPKIAGLIEPEDLASQAYLKILLKIKDSSLKVSDSFSGYLNKVVVNAVNDVLRKKSIALKNSKADTSLATVTQELFNPLEQFYGYSKEELRYFCALYIRNTTPNQISVDQMRVLKLSSQGYSDAQIATELNKTGGAIKALKHRANDSIKRWVDVNGLSIEDLLLNTYDFLTHKTIL